MKRTSKPPEEFIAYIAYNYSGTICIAKPEWHAKRIWKAAMRYLDTTQKESQKARDKL